MFKKFNIRELVLITLLTVIALLIGALIGQAIVALTGIPTAGSIWAILIVFCLFTLGAKIINKFGTISLMGLLIAILSVPTPAIGPPGLYKLPIVFIAFLISDLVISLFKRKTMGYYLGLVFATLLYNPAMYYSLFLMNMPTASKLKVVILPLTIAHAIMAIFGVWMGIYLFGRIKHKKIIRQFRN